MKVKERKRNQRGTWRLTGSEGGGERDGQMDRRETGKREGDGGMTGSEMKRKGRGGCLHLDFLYFQLGNL